MEEEFQVSDEELSEYLDVCVNLVKDGGNAIREAINKEKNISEKSGVTDLVTETDKAVEVLLVNGLKAKFPDHEFVGEEETAMKNSSVVELSNAPTWIIDPIDGTMNFVHSNPMVAISVGLTINRKIVLGIIYCPVIEMLYTAKSGQGAYLNGRPIKVSKCKKLSEAMIFFEVWAQSGEKNKAFQIPDIDTLWSKVHAFRSIGSAACNLAMVSAGQGDVYIQTGLHIWDMVAGAILVKEAGGFVCDLEGGEFDAMSKNILVAANKELAMELVALKLRSPKMTREHPTISCTLKKIP